MWSTWHQTVMHFYLHRYRIAVFQKLVPDNRSMISLNVCPCQHVIMPCVYTLTHSFIWTRPVQYKQHTYVSYFENFINPNRLMPQIIWVTKQYILVEFNQSYKQYGFMNISGIWLIDITLYSWMAFVLWPIRNVNCQPCVQLGRLEMVGMWQHNRWIKTCAASFRTW